jgi:hypothetical protein
MKKTLLVMVAGICAASTMNMSAVPTTTTFGSYPSATFGGSGIYNDAAVISTMGFPGANDTSDTITVVLAATPRGVGPELANNGVDTFFADPGAGSAPNRSKWNMDFDVNSSLGNLAGYTLTLIYGKEGGPMFTLNLITSFPDSTGAPGSWQNSENLGFGQFGSLGFDPTATGIYDFAVQVQKGDFVGTSGTMHVNVGAVPDGGSTAGMLAAAGLGLFVLNRKIGRTGRVGSR